MRLGFVITQDRELMHHLVTAKQSSDLHTNIFSQYMIADYLAHNEYQQHVDKITALYRTQAEAMLSGDEGILPRPREIYGTGGRHVHLGDPPRGTVRARPLPQGDGKKVAFVPGDPFYAGKTNVNTFRLNYTNSTPEIIREGIRRLAEVL